jgi:O-methyltransferase
LTYFLPGHLGLLTAPMPIAARLALLRAFLRIDWHVPHGHLPSEMATIARAFAKRRGNPGDIVIEAGCWQGGSTAKLSLLCALFGYRLHVYDSFQGVEPMTPEPGEWNFTGEYAATIDTVKANVARYGRLDLCTFHPGWFADTLRQPPAHPVRLVYIDCDVAKGTLEVVNGVLPALTSDAIVFSQDFHIRPVRRALEAIAPMTRHGRCLASFRAP